MVYGIGWPMNGRFDAKDGILFISEGAYLMGSWIDQELTDCEFAHGPAQMLECFAQTLPQAYANWPKQV